MPDMITNAVFHAVAGEEPPLDPLSSM